MNQFGLRRANQADYPSQVDIWRRVYGENARPEDWVQEQNFQNFYIGECDGRPGFAVIVNEYPVLVRGKVLRCAGIGAVATVPEMRNKGLAQFCMAELNRINLAEGFHIAALYGFRDTFYRKFGFESCGWRWELRCSADRFPLVQSELPVRLIPADEFAQLGNCYRAFISRMNGGCLRTDAHWQVRLGKKPQTLYAVGEPVEGYLWTDTAGFWNDLIIGEMAWSSLKGYEALLALIHALATNKGQVVWNEPPNSIFLARYMDSRVEAKLSRHTMFKVLDIQGVLSELEMDMNSITFEIFDDNGTTVKSFGHGGKVQMSHGAFIQGVMGTPSFDEQIQLGLVVGEKVALEYLQTKMRAKPVCCTEFF